jgi:ectoine hydroxylase
MKNWIQRYTGILRNVRILHYIYNLLHRKGLKHNKHLYPYYELNKSVYNSVSHRDFLHKHTKAPWLDRFVSEADIENHPDFSVFPETVAAQLLKWSANGYLLWEKFLDEETADAINNDIDNLLDKKTLDFNYTGRKLFNAYHQSYALRKVIKDKQVLSLLSFILGRKAVPFQTISFLKSSEQAPHSDAIHMSTFPQGYLIAIWIALEDIGPEQGALSYYPGSHRLPYITNDDYENKSNYWLLDGDANKKYEEKVQQVIAASGLPKQIFYAKKGDMFVWHGNLIHAGEAMQNPALSRKSFVAHYFAEGVICYHEISERPAVFDTELVGEVQEDFYKGELDFFNLKS